MPLVGRPRVLITVAFCSISLTQVEGAVDRKVRIDDVLVVALNERRIVKLVQRRACHGDVIGSVSDLGSCPAGLHLFAATDDI